MTQITNNKYRQLTEAQVALFKSPDPELDIGFMYILHDMNNN